MESLLIVIGTAAVNGLVTWGVIRAKLEFLGDGVKEAKAAARSAHERIDLLLHGNRRTHP